jgi:flagellar hook-basal body complex protein FliE
MSIAALGGIPPVTPVNTIAGTSGVGAVGPAGAAGTDATGAAGSTSGFRDILSSAVDSLSGAQNKADNLAVQAAAGTLQNPTDYLIAANEASLTTQITVAVRNKALDAFNEIMRMPL